MSGPTAARAPLQATAPKPLARIAIAAAFAVLWLWLAVAVPWRHLHATGGDFRAYHQAARALATGESPYTVPAFIYPPLLPVMLLPLAPLSLESARVAWFVASQLALLGSLWLTRPLCGGGVVGLAAVAAVWIAGGTVPENLVLGQVNPFLLLLIVAAMRLVPRRAHAGAALIGVAAALKVWPAALLVVFVWRREWRPLLTGVAVTLALVAAPAAITVAMVDDPHARGGEAPLKVGTAAPLNVSLPALALRLADPPRGRELPRSWVEGVAPEGFEPWRRYGWLAAAVAALVLVGSMGTLARWAPSTIDRVARSPLPDAEGRDRALELGAMVAAAILAAPIGWYHYQLCQFPGFAIALAGRLEARRYRAAIAIGLVLLALTRAQAWLFGRYVERFGFTAEEPAWLWLATTVGPVAGLVWLVLSIRQARGAARRAAQVTGRAA